MTEIPADLTGLQRWLQRAITTPWEAEQAPPGQVIRGDRGHLDPAERLGIYTRAYQGRLIECMESEFPVLRLALERDLFVRFASEYLIACPSQTYTLTTLGERFPQFLRETRPDDEDELWPDFIIELATLERFFSEVYHGEGNEESGGDAASETEAILAEPGTRWMHCRFPVDAFFNAARDHLDNEADSDPPEFPEPEPVALLLFRRDYTVQLRRVSPDELPVAEAG